MGRKQAVTAACAVQYEDIQSDQPVDVLLRTTERLESQLGLHIAHADHRMLYTKNRF